MSKWIISSLLLIASLETQAAGGSGALVSFNGFLYNQTRDTASSSSDDNTYIYDFKFGAVLTNKIYIGGLYTTRNHNGSTVSSEAGSATGASIGYMGDEGYFLMGHYIFSAKMGDYSEGSGLQADFGYLASLGSSFGAGVELTYRNIEYKKNAGSSTTYRVKEMFPMLSLAFQF